MDISFEIYRDRKELTNSLKQFNKSEVKITRVIKGVLLGIFIPILLISFIFVCFVVYVFGVIFLDILKTGI